MYSGEDTDLSGLVVIVLVLPGFSYDRGLVRRVIADTEVQEHYQRRENDSQNDLSGIRKIALLQLMTNINSDETKYYYCSHV